MECIPPTPSQPVLPCQVMISDGLFSQIGDTGELLGDQQLSLTPIPVIETNPDKNVNPEVHSFEGFSPEQLDVITPVQHNSGKMPQNNNPINPTIILVEPSMEDEAKNKKFLANDLALSKALANSAFGKAGISYVKKNQGRNILVVTMKKHYEDVSPFLIVLEIGAWKVKCHLPANQITSVGAIGPFGKDTSSEELTEALIDAGFGGVTVERIYKGKDKIVTAFFKVVSNTTTLPQFVRFGYQQYQVIECELHAIHEALSWISENSAPSDKYVIFTDSLCSLYLIRSTKPKYYIPLVYNIQNKLINIISSHCIRLQFIPGHRGVSGNEAADSTAKAAHLLRYRTLMPYSKEETIFLPLDLKKLQAAPPRLDLQYGYNNSCVALGWNKGNIVNKGKINLPSDLGLHGLVFEAPNKHDKEEEEDYGS
ncbi:Ribonuclease H domain [Trinorchestia longiramus]|nr:Ribonuclease H domain [Trinorchestia longiramus]